MSLAAKATRKPAYVGVVERTRSCMPPARCAEMSLNLANQPRVVILANPGALRNLTMAHVPLKTPVLLTVLNAARLAEIDLRQTGNTKASTEGPRHSLWACTEFQFENRFCALLVEAPPITGSFMSDHL